MNDENRSTENENNPESVEIAAIPLLDIGPALDVLETSFPTLSRSFFHSLIARDPAYRPEFSLGIRQGRVVLAFLQIFPRTLLLYNEAINFGGIGCVATRTNHRGKGYASALMRHTIRIMRQNAMAGGMLFTTIQPFYKRLGWRSLSLFEWDLAVDSLFNRPYRPDWNRGLKKSDYPSLQSIYETMQSRHGGGIVRTEAYWRARETWLTHFPVVIVEEGEIWGYFYYAQFDLKQPVMTVTEYGYVRADERIVDRLMRVIARKAEEINCRIVRGFFYIDPFFSAYCEDRNLKSGLRDFNYLMWIDLDHSNYIDRLQKHAENRLVCWSTDAF